MNAADQAYDVLRKRILAGELRPGDLLKERALCEGMKLSRTPVREALRRLSAEGLAEIRPRRSIVVTAFDPREVDEIFELGIVLESFVAGLAAEKATDADVARLDTIVADMATLLDGDHAADAYIRLDQAFHETIAGMARNPRISQILKQTMSIRMLSNIFQRYGDADFRTSLAQHQTILRAIAARDGDWAKSAMGVHIRTGQSAQSVAKARSSRGR